MATITLHHPINEHPRSRFFHFPPARVFLVVAGVGHDFREQQLSGLGDYPNRISRLLSTCVIAVVGSSCSLARITTAAGHGLHTAREIKKLQQVQQLKLESFCELLLCDTSMLRFYHQTLECVLWVNILLVEPTEVFLFWLNKQQISSSFTNI